MRVFRCLLMRVTKFEVDYIMEIKIGDKVRFLNDVGGGVVVGFNGEEEVLVEHDSGFEIPIRRGECVVIPSPTAPKEGLTSKRNIVESSRSQSISPNKYSVSLAFVPSDVNNLGSSSMVLYIINDSGYTLHFSIATVDGKGSCKRLKSGSMRPDEIMLVGEFARPKLPLLEKLFVQIIANKPFGDYMPQEPINRTLNSRLVKFSKRSSFIDSPRLGCDAMSVDLTSAQITMDEMGDLVQKVVESAVKPTIKSSIKQRRDNPATPEIIEVDLHIENLLDSTAGMNNGDILEYQLEHFRSTISQYSRYRGLKLVFIHGKGDGVLRQSIIKELKRMGRGDRYQEASFKRYGYGALMVVI